MIIKLAKTTLECSMCANGPWLNLCSHLLVDLVLFPILFGFLEPVFVRIEVKDNLNFGCEFCNLRAILLKNHEHCLEMDLQSYPLKQRRAKFSSTNS